jgi:hypothetical protein
MYSYCNCTSSSILNYFLSDLRVHSRRPELDASQETVCEVNADKTNNSPKGYVRTRMRVKVTTWPQFLTHKPLGNGAKFNYLGTTK